MSEGVLHSEAPVSSSDLVAMGHQPGPFTLLLDDQPPEAGRLECREVVRSLPGKRLVCRGQWQGEDVFVKLYLDGDRDWQGELRGLNALLAAGIAAPRIVHAGTADHEAIKLILLEPVSPAITLADAWEQAADDVVRGTLLEQAVRTIASHHLAGLEQRDIHLDNFLLSDEQLYTLDGGGIRVHGKGELSVRRSIDNLALFFAQFYPHHDALTEAAFQAYTDSREWPPGTVTDARLRQRVRHFRHKRQRHFLKKIFRNCSAYVCNKGWRNYRVYDRDYTSPAMLEFLADPDASLQAGDMKYLKRGNTCTLWTVRVGEQQLVVKRYNIKGFLHRMNRALRVTRASVSWKNANRLKMYGILTPGPIALVEERFGPLRGRAWFISEFMAGKDASVLCARSMENTQETGIAGASIVALLRQLERCRISHGDMKATNFILSSGGAAVIDLDAMREHDSDTVYNRLWRRDRDRFMHNWENCPEVSTLFSELLLHGNP